MRVMKASPKKEFSIATRHDERFVIINIKDTGKPRLPEEGDGRQHSATSRDVVPGIDDNDPELRDIIALLEDCGARIHRQREGNWNSMTIEISIAGR